MDRETALNLFNKVLDGTATAQETTDFIVYILSEPLSDDQGVYGCFEYVEVDDNLFSDDEEEILAQVAIQEDGPYTFAGAGFPKQRELQCQYPVSAESYLASQQLKNKLEQIAQALDTVWTNEPIPGDEDKNEKDIPLSEEMSF